MVFSLFYFGIIFARTSYGATVFFARVGRELQYSRILCVDVEVVEAIDLSSVTNLVVRKVTRLVSLLRRGSPTKLYACLIYTNSSTHTLSQVTQRPSHSDSS